MLHELATPVVAEKARAMALPAAAAIIIWLPSDWRRAFINQASEIKVKHQLVLVVGATHFLTTTTRDGVCGHRPTDVTPLLSHCHTVTVFAFLGDRWRQRAALRHVAAVVAEPAGERTSLFLVCVVRSFSIVGASAMMAVIGP